MSRSGKRDAPARGPVPEKRGTPGFFRKADAIVVSGTTSAEICTKDAERLRSGPRSRNLGHPIFRG